MSWTAKETIPLTRSSPPTTPKATTRDCTDTEPAIASWVSHASSTTADPKNNPETAAARAAF
jgi:hypothetical protein